MVYVPPHFIPEYPAARKHRIWSRHGWWLNRWPTLGWVETFVKMAAWGCAWRAAKYPPPAVDGPQRLAQTAILAVASALLVCAIGDRVVYREVISMGFVLPNNVAHWAVVAALARGAVDARYYRYFLWLMLAGDVVKLIFFVAVGFEIKMVAKVVIYSLVALFAAAYAACLAIEYGHYRAEVLQLEALLSANAPSVARLLQM